MTDKRYQIIRRTDNRVVETFATEREVVEYFLDEGLVHKGENYILKRPFVVSTG
ncbi:MAG: hypothetical protein OXB96_01115 [Candidatus Kaiserbacteria bacterium]|nr:hypothetical protein [Candidatus Kaiserbacteria bacterium]